MRIIIPQNVPAGHDAADWTDSEACIAWLKANAHDFNDVCPETAPETAPEPEPDRPQTEDVIEINAPVTAASEQRPTNGTDNPQTRSDTSLETGNGDMTGVNATEHEQSQETNATATVTPIKRQKRAKPILATVGGNAAPATDPELADAPSELSELGVAGKFVAMHCDKFRFVSESQKWYVWNGLRWELEPRRNTAMQYLSSYAVGLKYHRDIKNEDAAAIKFEGKKYLGAVLDLAEFDPRIIVKREIFDADGWLLGTPTGTVDLRTGIKREPRQDDYITRSTLIDPAPGEHPLFNRVIDCASNGDAEIKAYLWRVLGYFLVADCREESFWFLHGGAGCGKSTFVAVIAEILHEYACVSDMEAFTDSRSEKAPQHRAKLEGYRFTHASETNQNRKWNEAQINYITGRDKVEGQKLYENKRDFKMTARIMIHGNHIPKLRTGIAVGIKRRLHLIEYKGAITEPDTAFKDKLIAEYPAILHSMIKGCLQWQELGGLGRPQEISDNVTTYLAGEDSITGWADDCLEKSENSREQSAALYRSYKGWCAANNEYCPSSKEFSTRLTARGWESKHTNTGTVFMGYRIKTTDIDTPSSWRAEQF